MKEGAGSVMAPPETVAPARAVPWEDLSALVVRFMTVWSKGSARAAGVGPSSSACMSRGGPAHRRQSALHMNIVWILRTGRRSSARGAGGLGVETGSNSQADRGEAAVRGRASRQYRRGEGPVGS